MYLSGFKSLESLESLARLLKKVLKSCETFKIQDFANAIPELVLIYISKVQMERTPKYYFRIRYIFVNTYPPKGLLKSFLLFIAQPWG